MITVMGCDMGTRNFAVTVVKAAIRDGRFKFKIIGTKMLASTIHDVKIAQQQAKEFRKEFEWLPQTDYLAAERYQSRPGRGAGTTVESIGLMLGIVLADREDTPVEFYTAATWKNAFNRTQASLKDMYEDTKKEKAFVIHQLDSFLIALYHAAKMLNVTPYDFVTSFKDESRLVELLKAAPKL